MTSLYAALDVLLRLVYDTVAGLVAAGFCLYAIIAFIAVCVLSDAVVPPDRCRRLCRQPPWTPGDSQSLPDRPNAITMAPRCSATATVGRAFSETKV